MTALPSAQLVVRTIARTAIENEQRYGELDAVVGDGDFGASLARGCEALLEGMDGFGEATAGGFLKRVGMVITMRIGGTSGPIWGTAFLRAAAVAGDADSLSREDGVAMLRAAVAGIQERGRAELGDKTLLDALVPATDALEHAIAEGLPTADALDRAATAAAEAAEGTRALLARRGRASYAGERSIGTIDAGAVAVAEMLADVARAWRTAPPVSGRHAAQPMEETT